jgi:N6-adenosine-specific RNA methylase IME4
MQYSVILADPPWAYRVFDDSDAAHGAAKSHYPTMKTREIAALPIGDLAAKDSALFLWVTDPLLPEGLQVMAAWGFRYVTVGFYWVKLNKDGSPWFGLGHYTRGNPEMCLLGLRGRPARMSKSVPKLIMSGRREHSRKPDEQYERIARLYGGPYLELFARRQWSGWDVWGNEVESDVCLLQRQ